MLYKEVRGEECAVPCNGIDRGYLGQVLCREQCVTLCLYCLYGVAWYAVIGIDAKQSLENTVSLKTPTFPLLTVGSNIVQ